jgi:hypothetical protein
MELQFSTKDENNLRRENDFLKLSPARRLETFLQMINEFQVLPLNKGTIHKNDSSNNFVLMENA